MQVKTCWLVVVALAACDQGVKKPVEIKSGLRITYSIDGNAPIAAAVMQKRLDAAKVTGIARAESAAQIVVDLAAADAETIANAQDLIARRAKFDIAVVDDASDFMRRLSLTVDKDARAKERGIVDYSDRWQSAAGETHGDLYFTAADRTEEVSIDEAKQLHCFYRDMEQLGGKVRCKVTGRQVLSRYLVDTALLSNIGIPGDHDIVYERLARRDAAEPPAWRTYLVKHPSALAPDAIASTKVIADPNTHAPAIEVELRDDAAQAFGELTRANLGRKIALSVDGIVKSAPIVMEPITGGRVVLSLGQDATKADATLLARALASGPLPGLVLEETAYLLKDGKVLRPPAE